MTGPYRTPEKVRTAQRLSNYLQFSGKTLLITEGNTISSYKMEEFAAVSWQKLEFSIEADFGGNLNIFLKSGAAFSHTFIWKDTTPGEYHQLIHELRDTLNVLMALPTFLEDMIQTQKLL